MEHPANTAEHNRHKHNQEYNKYTHRVIYFSKSKHWWIAEGGLIGLIDHWRLKWNSYQKCKTKQRHYDKKLKNLETSNFKLARTILNFFSPFSLAFLAFGIRYYYLWRFVRKSSFITYYKFLLNLIFLQTEPVFLWFCVSIFPKHW